MYSKGEICLEERSNCPDVFPIVIEQIRLQQVTYAHIDHQGMLKRMKLQHDIASPGNSTAET